MRKYLLLASVLTLFTTGLLASTAADSPRQDPYPWLDEQPTEPLFQRFSPPPGYRREPAAPDSFASWLRQLPLKPGQNQVRLHNGALKANQDAHVAVMQIDLGKRNLQQCADATIRLRAEYLRAVDRQQEICFRFTSGHKVPWSRWRKGFRVRIQGSETKWYKAAPARSDYRTFRAYLRKIFQYAGTASLARELALVENHQPILIGDLFIQGGFPGHAVIAVDTAQNQEGKQVFLIAQSYMPAQEIHILKNPTDPNLSPWYRPEKDRSLSTPEWDFPPDSCRRFPKCGCSPY